MPNRLNREIKFKIVKNKYPFHIILDSFYFVEICKFSNDISQCWLVSHHACEVINKDTVRHQYFPRSSTKILYVTNTFLVLLQRLPDQCHPLQINTIQ